MCGRYSQTRPLSAVCSRFRARSALANLGPRYNIAPSQPAPIIIGDGDRTLDLFRWGLIPSWAKDPAIGYKMINARAETVAQKPSFRRPFQRNRCLVPADGFYEWRTDPTKKARTPMRVELTSRDLFAFAGLWDTWTDAEGRETHSFTIVTTAANNLVAPIHERRKAYEKGIVDSPGGDNTRHPRDDLSSIVRFGSGSLYEPPFREVKNNFHAPPSTPPNTRGSGQRTS